MNMEVPTIPTLKYQLLWAKSEPRHPLWKHMLDTAAVSLALSNTTNNLGLQSEEVAFLVGLHDIGKADSYFQHQIPDFSAELAVAGYVNTGDTRCRHERISARFIKNKLLDMGLSYLLSDAVSRAVLCHHGYWYETARPVGEPYHEAQKRLCVMLQQTLRVKDFSSNSLPKSDLSAFGMYLSGRIVLCDWIASNDRFFFDHQLKGMNDPENYFKKVGLVAQEWVRRLGLERNQQKGQARSVVETTRPIQQELLNRKIDAGLVIIEAPMGEGKTEAAWILAETWRDEGYCGMYMALPTMATSDSLYGRYRVDYLDKMGRGDTALLVHGMAWLRDHMELAKPSEVGEPGDDGSLAAAWFRPTRRAMLAAHGVGTIDQAMLAGMNVKFGFLRLFGLSNRVLVIDEVHAYDAYMSAIIARLLQWCACMKIPVILLSATLSAKQRQTLIDAYGATGDNLGPQAPYPLITVAENKADVWTIETSASSTRLLNIISHTAMLGDAKKTAAKANELVKKGGCCCVILNTVKQAQAVYKELKLANDKKLLFHSRFSACDRKRITDDVLSRFGKDTSNRPPSFVLVATQVVEQSLDVDFDHMISEVAPIDLLLQRSGRIHRHCKRESDPELHVLLPKVDPNKSPRLGSAEQIYCRYPILMTLQILKEKTQIRLPEDFRHLIETVYCENLSDKADDCLKDARQEWDDLQEDLASQAGEFLLCEPMADEFDPVGADEVGDDSDDGNGWRARTRLGLEDVLVVPITVDKMGDTNLKKGEITTDRAIEFFNKMLRIPPYYWPPKAAKGFDEPLFGQGALRGAWLLPVKMDGETWTWLGIKKDGRSYEIKYDPFLGLEHGGDK